jgi:hypothetical protein
MSQDATFEDGAEAPLNLRAFEGEDVPVISALVQDAIFAGSELRFLGKKRRFAMLINRFRWEDKIRRAERVQSVLSFEDVLKVETQGVSRDKNTVYSALSLEFQPGEDGTGALVLTLAGDGVIRLSVEALDVSLRDVTRPYKAPSGKIPSHE